MNIYKIWMRLYQLGEFEAKKNQPKSKLCLVAKKITEKHKEGREREREKEPMRS